MSAIRIISLSLLGTSGASLACNSTICAGGNQEVQGHVARMRIDGRQVAEIGWEKSELNTILGRHLRLFIKMSGLGYT